MAHKFSFVFACFVVSACAIGCGGLAQSQRANQHPAGFVKLFNGEDLTGWEKHGDSVWVIEDGLLIGTQGNSNAGGDLLTKRTYKDFIAVLTYRVEWPCESGLWFRYQSPQDTYRAEIIEKENPAWYSGTLYRSGKAFLGPGEVFLTYNEDTTLVDREGWNTMKLQAEGDHIRIWINGHKVADVHDDTSDSGKIGFHVSPDRQFEPMKIVVRELLVKPL